MSMHLFVGEPRQMARFGHLERGDVVEFTHEEDAYIKANPTRDFKRLTEDEAAKAEKAALDRRAKAAQEAEAAREEQRKSEPSLKVIAPTSDGLDELAQGELLDIVDKLNASGAGIKTNAKSKRTEIIAAIRSHLLRADQDKAAKLAREEDEAKS